MSWIFSFLLLCYAGVRIVLWTRGQLRWVAIRKTLPVPPTEISAPNHLSDGLAGLFLDSRRLRAELVRAQRVLATVEVTDPDAPLGQVRDRRFRRAIVETCGQVNHWLTQVENLDELDRLALEDRQLGPNPCSAVLGSLRETWRSVATARALDAFPIAVLLDARRAFAKLDQELRAIEDGLQRRGAHPYRDRFVHDRDTSPAPHSASTSLAPAPG